MKFAVRCKYRKGIRLKTGDVVNAPARIGDLRTQFELDGDTGQMVMVATLTDDRSKIGALLPDLRHVHMSAIEHHSLTLHGMELAAVGGEMVEVRLEWWVSSAEDEPRS